MKKVLSMLLVFVIAVSCLAACSTDSENFETINFEVKQIGKEQQIEVTWAETTYTTIDITVKHGEQVVATQTVDTQGTQSIILDAYYGKHYVYAFLIEYVKRGIGVVVGVHVTVDMAAICSVFVSAGQDSHNYGCNEACYSCHNHNPLF